ncbi:MAG: peptidoglycan DD-metalloendopeptidase family protein [Cytophagaceae bacterium]|nr:peptidoglycan DD-metalloendopeptidase family protein [Cytophagaceae bacterium]MBP6094439.1 peptidoglycan DD-metalloendopeptidase family protein [Cytophagaceae bacterium]
MIDRLFTIALSPSNSIALDLSAMNTELNSSVYGNTSAFCEYINEKLAGKIGFGGYLEHRVIYESHENFATASADFRNIHLGMDFWAEAGTSVFAPLSGVVHSFQVNPGSGNYGPTIILYHPEENIYSLYGHLASSDLESLEVGMQVTAGQKLCHLGNPDENGGWPPHLHFQLIRDLQGFQGDYPGVCSMRDVAFYAQNCPDPARF